MLSISIIPILIAILIILCVAYYFWYYNYINKRLADKCKKVQKYCTFLHFYTITHYPIAH